MAKKQTKTDLDKLSFEQSIEMLTEIVDKIETGQVPLAESLQQYEKGMGLIRHCRQILLTAEKRIEEIAGDEDDEQEDDTEADEDKESDETEDDGLF